MNKIETRTKKSARNALSGMISQIISILLSFVSRTVFIHFLSVDYLGVEGLFSNVLTILSLSELGIGGAIAYAMYRPMKEQNHDKVRQLVDFYHKAYKIIGFIIAIIGFILSFFIQSIISSKPNITENLQLIFGLFLLNNICSYFVAEKQTILIVNQDKFIDSYVKQACQVLRFVFQLVFLYTTRSYYAYLIIQVLFTLFNNISLAVIVNKKYPWITNKREGELSQLEKKSIFKDVKALAISKIAGVISSGADNIIVTKLFGLGLVGVMSNYNLVITAVNGVIWQGINNLVGNIGNFNSNADLASRRKIFDEVWVVTYWAYTFSCACLFILLTPFINLWLGGNYTVNQAVVSVLIANMFAGGIVFPMYSFRITSGIFDSVKWYYVISGIVNIVLSIFLGKIFGLFGIYLATILSRVLISDMAEAYYVNKEILLLPFSHYIFRIIGSSMLTVIISVVVKKIISFIPGDGVLTFAAKTFSSVALINAFLFLLFYRTDAFKRLKERIIRLF